MFEKTGDCALSCNAFILKYVPIVDRLHIAFSRLNSCEDSHFWAIYANKISVSLPFMVILHRLDYEAHIYIWTDVLIMLLIQLFVHKIWLISGLRNGFEPFLHESRLFHGKVESIEAFLHGNRHFHGKTGFF